MSQEAHGEEEGEQGRAAQGNPHGLQKEQPERWEENPSTIIARGSQGHSPATQQGTGKAQWLAPAAPVEWPDPREQTCLGPQLSLERAAGSLPGRDSQGRGIRSPTLCSEHQPWSPPLLTKFPLPKVKVQSLLGTVLGIKGHRCSPRLPNGETEAPGTEVPCAGSHN